MPFEYLQFYQFRNIKNTRVKINSPRIFLFGENGQGKTNFLEAVNMLCYGSSFRTRKDREILCHNCSEFSLKAEFYNEMQFNSSLKVIYKDQKKEIFLNDNQIKDRKDIINNIPCIVFCHDDINYVNGSPVMQRFFFDQTLAILNNHYIDLQRKFKNLLKARNLLLKNEQEETLSIYENQLAEYGLQIQIKRKKLIDEFNHNFQENYNKVSTLKSDISIHYRPSWKSENLEDIRKFLFEKRKQDMYLGYTSQGPHRDNIVFIQNKRDFTKSASTGQLRLLSLILRISQAEFFINKTGKNPVLLLDDVLLELDPQKRQRLYGILPAYDQIFFTFLPDEKIDFYNQDNSICYEVKEGDFIKIEK